jgi:hypothetical protein
MIKKACISTFILMTGLILAGCAGKSFTSSCTYLDETFCTFTKKWETVKDLKEFQVETVGILQGVAGTTQSNTTEFTLTVQGDKKYRMSTKMNGKEVAEVIGIDDKVYNKTVGSSTYLSAADEKGTNAQVTTFRFGFNDQSTGSVAENLEIKKVGEEDCGVLKCFKYQLTNPNAAVATESYIWFDTQDYLLRKMSMSQKVGEAGTNTTTNTYSYDREVINKTPIVAPQQ